MICAGVSVAFIIGIVLPWRALALTGRDIYSYLMIQIYIYILETATKKLNDSMGHIMQDLSHVLFCCLVYFSFQNLQDGW